MSHTKQTAQNVITILQKYIKNSIWLKVLIVYLLWHLAVGAVGLYSRKELGSSSPAPTNIETQIPKLLSPTVAFDSYHYLQIFENGYGQEKNASPAFFPLFPALIRVGSIAGINAVAAGFLINLILGYLACLFLVLLAKDFFKSKSVVNIDILIIFLVFPSAYFMTAFYTEALFCSLGFGAFYFARRQNWALACLLLAGITATRLPGLVFGLAVFVEYLSSKNFDYRRLDRNILWFLLVPTGIALYMVFLNIRFGDPIFFINAYDYGWGYQKFNPNILATVYGQFSWLVTRIFFGNTQLNVGGNGIVMTLVFLFSWLALVGSTGWAIYKKYPASFVVLMAVSAVLFSLNSNFISSNRYILPMFPIYLLLSQYFSQKRTALTIYLVGSTMAMTLLLVFFSAGRWTG